ncbi:MAG TPA: hypothetical protein VFU06_12570 [Longimicrobiales bacterium]|nr:hypothetical protein [Longimicrobiales bacterium]
MPIPVRLPRLLSIVLLASIPGCERVNEPAPIPDETFVQVMVDLRRAAAVNTADTTGFFAMRDSILAAAGVSDSALYAWVNATARDPERMGRVFREIRDSVRARPDTVPR